MRADGGLMKRGFTLVELIIAIIMAGLVMGAVYQVLAKNQRFYRAQSQVTEVQQNVRAVAAVLPGDLRELAASDGDIKAMGDSSITIRAMRSFTFACAPPDPATGAIVVRNSTTYGYRSMDATRDSLLVFRDGDSSVASDDRWILGGLASVTTPVVCTDGSAGTLLRMSGANIGLLDSVRVGAPLRTFETVRYEYYDDGTGTWWLGVQSVSNGAWSALSPVAGPLSPGGGLRFTYLDANNNVTAVPGNVAAIRVFVRGQSSQQIMAEGRPRGFYRDSLQVLVSLRNN